MQPYPPARPPLRPVTRKRGGGRKSSLAKTVAVLIFGLLTVVAMFGFISVVGATFVYSRGLPPPELLEEITFAEDSIIYARDGKTRLATFSSGGERRRVVKWEDVPPILADATTAVEDKTFWANTGIDPLGIASAAIDTFAGDARGGSTITQQLVRQKLLPDEVMRESSRFAERKVKELIQSIRVTDAFRGREGKEAILTAYLNQNFYGNNSYGVQAAAQSYFGKANLDDLTIAEAATLAALPQAPSTYDLVRNAIETDDGRLVVPADSAIVRRRNLVLDLLANDPTRRELTGNTFSRQDFLDAKTDELELVSQRQTPWRAPHFVWYVREELREALCGEAETCDALRQGGLRVTTTLDWSVQKKAEKWVQAATLLPHRADPTEAAKALKVRYAPWIRELRDQNVWNGALSALDYETGEIIAYVGSANYYERRKVNKRMQPQFDVLSDGWRQPGSAFKPFNYATGINDRSLTAATMLMDVTTDFGGGYTPTDFNGRERGPLRVRDALQFSLNVPAVKALGLVGERNVFDKAQEFGMQFQRRRPTAGLSMALGTLEVHPIDLNQSYATLANGGVNVGRSAILSVKDTRGNDVLEPYQTPKGRRVISEQAAFVMTDILAGNTDPSVNPVWAEHRITAKGGRRRPAALKTGTSNDAKDLNAYGYIAPPSRKGRREGEYALAVGVWAGNSNSSPVTTVANPVFSLDVAAPLWDAFLSDVTRTWEIRNFKRPGGLNTATVDTYTGFQPSQWSRRQVTEFFLQGTSPQRDPYIKGVDVVRASDGEWYLWEDGCDGRKQTRGFLVLDDAESHHRRWNEANRGWATRARRGVGVGASVAPDKRTYTAHFFEPYYQPYGNSWGAPFAPTRSCQKAPQSSPSPEPSASPSLSPEPSPPVEPSPIASEPPTATQPPKPTEKPTPEPTKPPKPTEKPTPEPTQPPATPSPTEVPPPPTEVPTVEPTEEPTEVPTPEPTALPTLVALPELTAEPTLPPTPEPTPKPAKKEPPPPTVAPEDQPSAVPAAPATETPPG